jgi:hypothetical protein
MRRVVLILAVCACGLCGCACDPELARYIGNERVHGDYTAYDLRQDSHRVLEGARDVLLFTGYVALRMAYAMAGAPCPER